MRAPICSFVRTKVDSTGIVFTDWIMLSETESKTREAASIPSAASSESIWASKSILKACAAACAISWREGRVTSFLHCPEISAQKLDSGLTGRSIAGITWAVWEQCKSSRCWSGEISKTTKNQYSYSGGKTKMSKGFTCSRAASFILAKLMGNLSGSKISFHFSDRSSMVIHDAILRIRSKGGIPILWWIATCPCFEKEIANLLLFADDWSLPRRPQLGSRKALRGRGILWSG